MVEKLDYRKLEVDFYEVIPDIYLLVSTMYSDFVKFLEENFPGGDLEDRIIELNRKLGSFQAKKFKEAFKESEGSIDLLLKAFALSHWGVLEDVEIVKKSRDELVLQTRNCTWQKYKLREEGSQEDCKSTGLAWRSEFCKQIDSDIEVERVFGPPHDEEVEVWCRWRFTLEE